MSVPHPTITELLDLVENDLDSRALALHLQDCLACRVRLSRLRDEHGYEAPNDDAISRLHQASGGLGVAIREAAAAPPSDTSPQVGELWRVGLDYAILVWVRKQTAPTILDVVPVVLDTDLADESTLLVGADESPLGIEMAVMTALRTHIHRGAFLNSVGPLDISDDVENLIMGKQTVAHTIGAPVVDAHDQRIEYRQAVADLVSDLSPTVWHDPTQPNQTAQLSEALLSDWRTELNAIAAQLHERTGAKLRGVQHHETSSPSGRFVALDKADYLDTAVLIVATDETGGELVARDIVESLEQLLDDDVDAIAVSRPASGWETILITRTDMRPARRASGGGVAWPRVTLEGMDLLDTLHKHFERAQVAWDVVVQADRSLEGPDIREAASAHAREALTQVRLSGGRARSPKKETWLNISDEVADRVVDLVAAASDNDIDRAFELLGMELTDD